MLPVDHTVHSVDGNRVRIARPRLAARLRPAEPGAIVVLAGPCGTGKSELVRTPSHDATAIVMRVGNENATFGCFVHGLAQAVAHIAPGAQASFPRAWERALQYGSPSSVLAHWLSEHLSGVDLDLIIDDLHDASGEPNIAAFIAKLADLLPRASLTLTVRSTGALPIARWMATSRMERPIDESDLRFTLEETVDAARLLELRLSSADVRSLLEATGGLAVAVMYALTHPCGLPFASPVRSFDQIAAEVFGRRSGAERAFIYSACLYPSIDDELLRVAGWDDAKQIRSAIGADAAFLWQRDARGVLRFHDRFRDYVAREFAHRDADFRTTIARRTVHTLTLAGRHADALGVATRQQLGAAMGDLLDRYGFEMLESGHIDTITEALDTLDRTGQALGAKAEALHGYLDARRGRLDTAEAYFRLGLEQAPDEATRVVIAMYYARELAVRRREDSCDALEPFVESTTLPSTVRVDVRSSYAQALTAANRLDEARALTDEVVAHLEPDAAPALRARVYARAAYVALECGDYELARERARIAAPVAIAASLFDVAASAYSVLYNVACEIDDDAVASLAYLRAVRDMGVKSGSLRLDLYALFGMYNLQAEAGDEAALAELDRQIAAVDKHEAGAQITEALIPAQSLQAAWHGDFAAARRLLRPTAPVGPGAARRARCWAEVGLYCAAEGDVTGTHEALAAAREALREPGVRTAHITLTTLIIALAAWIAGDAEAARVAAAANEAHDSARIRAMRDVLASLVDGRFDERRSIDRLAAALAALRSVAFGGMARLIEALPHRIGSNHASTGSIGTLLAAHELPAQFAAALATASTAPLFSWLDLHPTVGDELELVDSFDRWSAGRRSIDGSADAAIAKLRGELTTRRRRVCGSVGRIDEIDLAMAALFEQLDGASPLMAEHSRAVSAWCSRLARALDLPEREIEFVTRGGLIHDIGKMQTPAEILHAPRHLTPDEWAIMQRHTVVGGQLVAEVPYLRAFIPIVRGHHERLDGKGYPDGLRGSAIPLAARIVSVADTFNAMIGRRPYRPPMSPMNALDELQRSAGTQLDPEVVEAMVRIVLGRIALTTAAG